MRESFREFSLRFLSRFAFGLRQFAGELPHQRLQIVEALLRRSREAPLFSERVGELEDFDIVERLLENHQLIWAGEFLCHFVPGIIGGRADDYLHFRIQFGEAVDAHLWSRAECTYCIHFLSAFAEPP